MKRAQTLAREIEDEIASKQLVPGHNLGNEAELLSRYPVSRPVLREALALIERGGRAQVRRGNLGGLVVIAPSVDAIASTLRNYIDYVTLDVGDQYAARHVLDDVAAASAMKEMDISDLAEFTRLTGLFESARTPAQWVKLAYEMHLAILDAAKNPCLSVFSRALATAGISRLSTLARREQAIAERAREICANRRDCLQAIIASDQSSAFQSTKNHHRIHSEIWRESERSAPHCGSKGGDDDQSLFLSVGLGEETPKLAQSIAERIQADILNRGLKPGEKIGSEGELIAQLGVGRGVFREAIRVLERLSIVTASRGKYGGLKVSAPDHSLLVESAASYLQTLGVQTRHLVSVGKELSLLGVTLATQRKHDISEQDFLEASNPVRISQGGGSIIALRSAYFQFVGRLSGNPPLAVLMAILARVEKSLAECTVGSAPTSVAAAELDALLDAIRAGNVSLARRRIVMANPPLI